MRNELISLYLSDVHFGNKYSGDIYINILNWFKDYNLNHNLRHVDYLFITGDFFDSLLLLNSESAIRANQALKFIVKIAKAHNIKLRILEGTPRHDRKQYLHFIRTHTELLANLDFLYISELCVIEESEGEILYIPDLANIHPDIIYEKVLELRNLFNVKKFLKIIMHGGFDFNLGIATEDVYHIADNYSKLSEHYVVSGHVHNHGFYNNVISPGSFDRLRFGEEHIKGVLFTKEVIGFPNNDEFILYPNPNPIEYMDIELSNCAVSTVVSEFGDWYRGRVIRHNAPIRFLLHDSIDSSHEREIITSVNSTYNLKLKISFKYTSVDEVVTNELVDTSFRNEDIETKLIEKLEEFGLNNEQNEYILKLYEKIRINS